MERNMSNIKERILYYTDIKGFSKESFFEDLGVTYGSFKGKSKEQALSSDVLERIITKYDEISLEWLLTGRGRMLKNESITILDKNRKTTDKVIDSQNVPFYDLEATAGLKELFSSESPSRILDTIKIPNLPKCDGAITVTGDSMYPLLKSGDIVLYKETVVEDIFFGEMYLLSVQLNEWDEYITVKYIQKSEEGSEYVKLVSQNQHHQPKDILKSKITALAMVKASIRINTMM